MLTSDSGTSPLVCKRSQDTCSTPRSRTFHDLLLEVLDVILSCVIVAPCVVSYWRGTWELMGVLLYRNNVPLSALMSFLIGVIGHTVFTLTQTFFKNNIHPDKRRLTYYVISRAYTAIFGIVCVNMWRGSWILCDWLTSADSLMIIYAVTLVALMFLVATRTVRNLAAAPYMVAMDHKTDYFDVDTMFKIPGFKQPGLFLLDTLFSVLVIGTLVVIAWRGLWGIMDFTLYPEDRALSSWGSLVMGYIVAFVTFSLRPLVSCFCTKIDEGILKLILCDFFYFMVFFGAVNVWRGIWNLLDIYLYPDDKILSYWITHVIPFLILAALKCSNSILVRGVYIDAEDDSEGDCVSIPIYYVKLHFQRERNKKAYNMQTERDFPKNNVDKEAHSTLLEKDKRKTPKIQSGINANESQIV